MKITNMNSVFNTPQFGNVNKSLAFSPRTAADWVAYTRGNRIAARFGYFGAGMPLMKDITTTGDTFVAADFFTNTFGAKVWDSLNSQTRFFNLIRKVAWGNTTGWRIRSGRNTSTRGVGETDALPTIDSSDLEQIYVHPRIIVTSMGVSAIAQFLGTLEGGIGDALAVQQETSEVDHLKTINQMLLAPSEVRVANGGGTPDTLVSGAGDYVFPGDTFHTSADEGESKYIDITSVTGDSIAYTSFGSVADPVSDTVLYARARGGLWSLSDIINEDGRTVNGVSLTNGAGYGSLSFGDRTAGGWNAAGHINSNSGNIRHLTTGHLDRVIQRVRHNGFHPDMILLSTQQETRLGTLLQANQHFIGNGTFEVKQGGESTLPGYETGFQVATYKHVPIFLDEDTPPVWQRAANGDAIRGEDVFVLDTRYLEMPVLWTTQYIESRDYIHNNFPGLKAIYLTAMNLRCRNFRAQGKVTDLSDGTNLN